jgi:chemotaxis protein MotB
MARKQKHPEHVNHERWLVSYADFVTLLFAFFVVMFAVSQVDTKKMGRFTESFTGAVTWNMFDAPGKGMMPHDTSPSPIGEAEEAKNGKGKSKSPSADNAPAKQLKAALESKLRTKAELSSLRVIEARGEIILRLPERLLFDVAAADIRPEGRSAVLLILAELAKHDVAVRVEGHTDSTPIHTEKFPSNWELSGARAMSVLRVITETNKMSPDRLSGAGYGEHHPIAPNDTLDGRAQNRRVDLVIVVGDEQAE